MNRLKIADNHHSCARLKDERRLTADDGKDRVSKRKQKLFSFLLISAIFLYVYLSITGIRIHVMFKLNEVARKESFERVDNVWRRMRDKKSNCELPLSINPFDDFVKPFIKPDQLKCLKEAPLTYVDYDNGLLLYTKDGIESGFACYYSWLYRINDNNINMSNLKYLPKSGVKFSNKNYIAKVKCYGKPKLKISKVKYVNLHFWIPNYEKTNATGPSVFVLVVESLSGLSFQRFMSKTNLAMKQLNDFTILEALMKVGLNSFPNSMALLTGIAVENDYYVKGYWDNKYEYIWNQFKYNGYITAFVEDFVPIGLFNYMKKGFKTPPTDFYPRPFWLKTFVGNVEHDELMKNKTHFCYKNHGSKAELFLEQVFQFARKMALNDQPYFMYSFLSQLTHANINNFQYVDDNVADFIHKMSPYLSNTILIIMGDHGPRYGTYSYLDSPMGLLEGRLPFFAIRIPEQLDEKFPHLRKVIELNKQSLLSWFDIHQLLLDLSQQKYEFEEGNVVTKGINPLRNLISPERTCESASINKMYCVCNRKFQFDPWETHERVNNAVSDFESMIQRDYVQCTSYVNKVERMTSVTEILLPNSKEKFVSVEHLNITLFIRNPNAASLNAVLTRFNNNPKDQNWSPWAIDNKYTDINLFRDKVKKIFCKKDETDLLFI